MEHSLCGPIRLLLREKLGVGVPRTLCWGSGGCGESISYLLTHLDVDIFSVAQCIGVTQLVFGFIAKGIALCVAVYLLHPWEAENSRACYVAIVVWSLCLFLWFQIQLLQLLFHSSFGLLLKLVEKCQSLNLKSL